MGKQHTGEERGEVLRVLLGIYMLVRMDTFDCQFCTDVRAVFCPVIVTDSAKFQGEGGSRN